MKKILAFIIALHFMLVLAPLSAQEMTNMENYRIYKMSEYLELTPEQAETFFPLLRQYEKELAGISEQENKLYESVKSRQKKGGIGEGELQQIMKQVEQFERQRTQLKQQFMQRAGKALSPGQASRIPFFEKEFRRELKREFIQRQQGRSPVNNPGSGGGNPGNQGGQRGRP